MTLVPREDMRSAAGRLIACGFDGTQVTAELREILREVQPSGLVLFARNIESPEQVAELIRELKSLRPDPPLFFAVDQEGGRVARVRAPATEWPPMRLVGQTGDAELARQVGEALGREMRALGFDVDFAPVLDVDTNPDNPIIGDRAFHHDPTVVARLGAALVQGLQGAGVAACGKHFPGHGDTDLDSHLALPAVDHDLQRLREIEWPPFAAAIQAGLGSIMTAHVVMRAIDESQPATLSPTVLSYLREELGFDGVICSDDVEMKAVADHYSAAEIGVRGLGAGVDLFLACHLPEVILDLYRGIVQGVEQQQVSHERLLASRKRVDRWVEQYYRPPGPADALQRWLGCGEHAALVQAIESRAAELT